MTVLENVLVYAHDQPGERLTRVFATPKRVGAEEHRARARAHALLESVSSRISRPRGRRRCPAARRSCSSWRAR